MNHLVVPDTQIRPGISLDHIRNAGELAASKMPEVIVFLMDWWDFPSLSTHNDRGSIEYHNKSYIEDLQAGIEGMELFLKAIEVYNATMTRQKKKKYIPRLIATMGNHEYRRNRLESQLPKLIGALPTPENYLWDKGFEIVPYKQCIVVDGITYSHLCPQSKSAGAIERPHLIAQKRYASWTVGHTQGLEYFISYHEPRIQCIIAGSFYDHDEAYKEGANDHWRGIIYKHVYNTRNIVYDPEFINIERLK